MMRSFPSLHVAAALYVALAVVAMPGCSDKPTKEEQEAARNTFACTLSGERLVVRFGAGEARILMPGGERVVLYQLPSASGIRFSNGSVELRGKGTDLQYVVDGNATPLADCKPYELPPKAS
jgi:membrane-bound inhibitor of C-type lysozyme